ncbi:MAG: hypothetical protein NPIRA02_15220 [Nitrospirales bacterium]|nr:MAG: hypothetical protein NPIRA02_15220 [Nitrospirales bacterium]
MKINTKRFIYFRQSFALVLGTAIAVIMMQSVAWGMNQVGMYDVWEHHVTNSKKYSNPFDYNVIELQATFTSPSGKNFNFFGFYDGNGNGGQNGDVWKLRFMPDKVGTWTYTYRWTDGTSGDSGSFQVVDTGLPGPLKVASDNSWYFDDARGNPFHFRGYDIHHIMLDEARKTPNIVTELKNIKNVMNTRLIGKDYNFTMIRLSGDRKKVRSDAYGNRSFWLNTTDKKTFDISVWRAWEDIIEHAKKSKVYVIPFSIIAQKSQYDFKTFKVFLRHFVARYSAYYNFFGWSPVWEWSDIWSASEVSQIMMQLQRWDPFQRLLTIHDCSDTRYTGWLDFSMRQASLATASGKVRDVFAANSRRTGQQQGSCNASGGVGLPFLNKPIIGSEDIWENISGTWGQPRNRVEVRRAAWGIQMAGVMPLYSEWNNWNPGKGTASPDIRRMFDFFYSNTRYRQYKQLNHLVSKNARQIASGKEGLEYVVYDENGGDITIDLSDAGGANTFDVLWYNPISGSTKDGGKVNGGASRTLHSPISGDTVLLLTRGKADTVSPKAPTKLSIRSVERF